MKEANGERETREKGGRGTEGAVIVTGVANAGDTRARAGTSGGAEDGGEPGGLGEERM